MENSRAPASAPAAPAPPSFAAAATSPAVGAPSPPSGTTTKPSPLTTTATSSAPAASSAISGEGRKVAKMTPALGAFGSRAPLVASAAAPDASTPARASAAFDASPPPALAPPPSAAPVPVTPRADFTGVPLCAVMPSLASACGSCCRTVCLKIIQKAASFAPRKRVNA